MKEIGCYRDEEESTLNWDSGIEFLFWFLYLFELQTPFL